MKARLLLVSISLFLSITSLHAQQANPTYLAQFPKWERIQAEIKGNDPMDTAARKMGACWQFKQLIYDLAWATQRRGRNRLTQEESALVNSYDTGYFLASQPFLKIQNTPGHPERQKWHELHSFYEADTDFLDELLKKLTSSEFRAGYYKSTGKQPPSTTPAFSPKPVQPAVNNTSSYAFSQLMDEGVALFKEANYSAALDKFKQATTLQPNSPDAHLLTGRAYRRLNQHQNALNSFRQSYKLAPDGVSLGEVAGVLADLDQVDEALRTYLQALKLSPSDVNLYDAIGAIQIVTGKFPDAMETFQQAIRLKPKDESFFLWHLGIASVLAGRKDLASRIQRDLVSTNQLFANELLKAINNPHENGGVLVDYADFRYLMGDVAYAKAAYRLARRISPADMRVLDMVGLGLNNLKQSNEALEVFGFVLAGNPSVEDRALAHYGIALVYRNQKDYPKAIAAFNQSMKIHPAGICSDELGSTYLQLKDYPNAVIAFQQATRLDPQISRYHLHLGQTYLLLNQPSKAVGPLKEAARLTPNESEVFVELGNAFLNLTQYQDALANFSTAVRLLDFNAAAHFGLGKTFNAMGNKAEAMKEHAALVKLDRDLANKLLELINRR